MALSTLPGSELEAPHPPSPKESRSEFGDLSACAWRLSALVDVLHEMSADLGRQSSADLNRHAWLSSTARDQARLLVETIERADVARTVLQQTVDHRGTE